MKLRIDMSTTATRMPMMAPMPACRPMTARSFVVLVTTLTVSSTLTDGIPVGPEVGVGVGVAEGSAPGVAGGVVAANSMDPAYAAGLCPGCDERPLVEALILTHLPLDVLRVP